MRYFFLVIGVALVLGSGCATDSAKERFEGPFGFAVEASKVRDGALNNAADTLIYYPSADGVTVNLATNSVSGGHATGDVIDGLEGVNGSNTGGDTITGTSGIKPNQLVDTQTTKKFIARGCATRIDDVIAIPTNDCVVA